MTCQLSPTHPKPPQLTPDEQGRIFGILSVGCDRETAANFVGCSLADIGRAMRRDREFATAVRRTEASAELKHMRVVDEAVKDPKNWRASVWWLERRSPERFGPRRAGKVTTRNLKLFIQLLSDYLHEDVQDPHDRARVLTRFQQLQGVVAEMADEP